MEFSHPMRDAPVHVFQRTNPDGHGSAFIARFWPYSTYPVFATGQTEDEARTALETLRTEAIEKHEAAYIARREAAAARKAKAEAKAREAAQ